MAAEEEKFDDPRLKTAVRRAFGGEHASVALRTRVSRALEVATASEPAAKPEKSRTAHPTWLKYAVAALVLLVIAAGIEHYLLYEPEPAYDHTAVAYALPDSYRDDMVKAHSEPLKSEFTDRATAETRLSDSLKHKVIVPDLPGWTFKGAQIITVAQQPGVRAVYQRGDQSVSLFSIASGGGYYGMPDGVNYDQTCGTVAIAGIVRGGMIYCVFTEPASPENIREVTTLRDSFAKGL